MVRKVSDGALELLRLVWDEVFAIKGTNAAIIRQNDRYGLWDTHRNTELIAPVYKKYAIQAPIVIFQSENIQAVYGRGSGKTVIYNRFSDEVTTYDSLVFSTRVRGNIKVVSLVDRRLLLFKMNDGAKIFDANATYITYPVVESQQVAAFIDIRGKHIVAMSNGSILSVDEYMHTTFAHAYRYTDEHILALKERELVVSPNHRKTYTVGYIVSLNGMISQEIKIDKYKLAQLKEVKLW